MTLATGLPPLKVVTVTLETCGFFAAAFLTLGLRDAFLGAEVAVAVLGINALRDYSHSIPNKKPLKRGFVTYCCKKVQFVNCPIQDKQVLKLQYHWYALLVRNPPLGAVHNIPAPLLRIRPKS